LCCNLTPAASFSHLPVLALLDCSYTKALEEGLGALPPSLQELRMNSCKYHSTLSAADFSALPALRVLSWSSGGAGAVSTATLPPTLEVLDIFRSGAAVRVLETMSLAHLPQLRAFCAACAPIDDATVAALPTGLVELDVLWCDAFTRAVSFAHLRVLRALNATGTKIHDAGLASLPPSLVSLHIAKCKYISRSATLPDLPALQKLDASGTSIGDGFVASLPRSLTTLRITDCANVTRAAEARHLTALRKLHSSGTDLPLSMVAALRARGCFAPAEPVLADPDYHDVLSMVVLADGHLVTTGIGKWRKEVRLLVTTRDGSVTAPAVKLVPLLETERAVKFAVLPDGRRLAVVMYTRAAYPYTGTGREAGSIEVWDTATTPPTRRTAAACADFRVFVLAVLRDGRLAAGCEGGRIRLVDVDAGTVGGDPSLCHAKDVSALAVFPDGTTLASGAHDATVRVWNVSSGVCVAVLTGHRRYVRALAVLASGHLASAGEDCAVRLWDAGTWTCYATFTTVRKHGHTPTTHALLALPDGRLACGDSDGVIRVWDTRTCLPLVDGDAAMRQRAATAASCAGVGKVEVKGHTDFVDRIALLPDGRLASRGWGDTTIRVWRLPPLEGVA